MEFFSTPPPSPAQNLCLDKGGWLWWSRGGTISVASVVDAAELTLLDTFELYSSVSSDSVCLLVPQTDQSGVYALTERGRLLWLSVSDSRLSAVQLADFGMYFTEACIADDSSRTIVAYYSDDAYLIDLPDRTISPLSLPISGYVCDLAHVGGTRLVAALLDGTICLFDSQDSTSALKAAKAPQFVEMFIASPNRALIALDVGGRTGANAAVDVRNAMTLEQTEYWQTPTDDHFVTGVTWLDDEQLAISLYESNGRPRTDRGEIAIVQLGSTRRRRLKFDFETWAILAIAPNRLAIADRDGGVRIIQLGT